MAEDRTRITVNLIPRAAGALTEAMALTGYTQTDVVNRALQVYALFEDQVAQGKQWMLVDKDGTMSKVRVL